MHIVTLAGHDLTVVTGKRAELRAPDLPFLPAQLQLDAGEPWRRVRWVRVRKRTLLGENRLPRLQPYQ